MHSIKWLKFPKQNQRINPNTLISEDTKQNKKNMGLDVTGNYTHSTSGLDLSKTIKNCYIPINGPDIQCLGYQNLPTLFLLKGISKIREHGTEIASKT